MMHLICKMALPKGERSYRNFVRFKFALWALMMLWLLAAIAIIGFWNEIGIVYKVVAIGYCCLVIPNFNTFEELVMPFEKYKRDAA